MTKHLAKVDVQRYLHGKRLRKTERRRRRKLKAAESKKARFRALTSTFGNRSKIIRMMVNETQTARSSGDIIVKHRRCHLTYKIRGELSVIDSPTATLQLIHDFACQLNSQSFSTVFLDFDSLTHLDLGASALLNILVEEYSTQARLARRFVNWCGTYPNDGSLKRFTKAMGVIKRLKIAHEYPPKAEECKLRRFYTRCRHYERSLQPRQADEKTKKTASFADHINNCLASVNRELNEEARSRLCQYVGEIIDNAEEHSEMCDWTIEGYLDTHLPNPMCEIVIFNFGKTIANSFEVLPIDSYARQQVEQYVDYHKNKGWFKPKWCKESLYTLVALQGGISSKNLDSRSTRGNGSVDLINFFQKVHAECTSNSSSTKAYMALLSGSTYIKFDGTYEMKENDRGISVIAFNNANDLNQPPDPSYVQKLDGIKFPGTLISIKFPLTTSTSTVITSQPE